MVAWSIGWAGTAGMRVNSGRRATASGSCDYGGGLARLPIVGVGICFSVIILTRHVPWVDFFCATTIPGMANQTTPVGERPGDLLPTMVDVAQDYIREQIASGVLSPGDRLKERDLVTETGVSRIPIREALRNLASEGFIELSPRRGAVVARLEPADLEEIFEVRFALEVQEAGLAARKATADEVARMFDHVTEAEEAMVLGDREAVDTANRRFHEVLVEMTHNRVLAKMLEPLQSRLNWLLKQNSDVRPICVEHRAIADAIAAGKVADAQQLALVHVQTSKEIALAQLFGKEIS